MNGTAILINLLAGVALLLWGSRMIRTGVMRAFGSNLRNLLGGKSQSRILSALSGVVAGTVLQSSTAVALLVGSFSGQGLVACSVALAVMLGADLGSSFAALVFSSGIASFWPLLAFGGYVIHTVFEGRNNKLKAIGRVVIGLGLLFLGLKTLGSSAADLSSSPVVMTVINAASSETLIAILVGVVLTWMAHSSIAVVLLAVSLVGGGAILPEQLYAFVLGVNIGAALPAISATLSESVEIRRVPLGNLLFRICGVLLAIPFIPIVSDTTSIINTELGNTNFGNIGPGFNIIIFHLMFNAVLLLTFIGLTQVASRIVERILPDPQLPAEEDTGPRYLDHKLFDTPSAALSAAARETLRIGDMIKTMLEKTKQVLDGEAKAKQQNLGDDDDIVDELNNEIKFYLTKLMSEELDSADTKRAIDIITFTTNLEHVGDIIERNLMGLAAKKQRSNATFSEAGHEEINAMYERVLNTLDLAMNTFLSEDVDSARELIARKTELRQLERAGTERHLERLSDGQHQSLLTSGIHLDVIRDFKRVNSHLTSVAYPVLERAGELRPSRLTKKAAKQIRYQPETLNS